MITVTYSHWNRKTNKNTNEKYSATALIHQYRQQYIGQVWQVIYENISLFSDEKVSPSSWIMNVKENEVRKENPS